MDRTGRWINRRTRALLLLILFISGLSPLFLADAAESGVRAAWARRLNGQAGEEDEAAGLAVDGQGNVLVTGRSRSWGPGTPFDYLTAKYGPDGRKIWSKRYSAPGYADDEAVAVGVDSQGNVYVTGTSIGDTGYDYFTIKYNPEGQAQWGRRYKGEASFNNTAAMVVDVAGNVYVTGKSLGSTSGFDYLTIKYDTDGQRLWARRYNSPVNGHDYAAAIAVDGQGNVFVTGYSPDNVGYYSDYVTVKYGSDGQELWVARYNGPGNQDDEAAAIAVDGQGNVVVTGMSRGSANYDFATVKYSPEGARLWARRYNGPGDAWDEAVAVGVDGQGNVFVTGYSGGVASGTDYATIKYSPEGSRLWVKRYNGPANAYDAPAALAVDSQGNAYVTGESRGTLADNDYDYATLKYSPDGALVWARRYKGPGNFGSGRDAATALVVDAPGNVYVTGASIGFGTNYDYLTIKYLQTPD